jgi:hypothetical protein
MTAASTLLHCYAIIWPDLVIPAYYECLMHSVTTSSRSTQVKQTPIYPAELPSRPSLWAVYAPRSIKHSVCSDKSVNLTAEHYQYPVPLHSYAKTWLNLVIPAYYECLMHSVTTGLPSMQVHLTPLTQPSYQVAPVSG